MAVNAPPMIMFSRIALTQVIMSYRWQLKLGCFIRVLKFQPMVQIQCAAHLTRACLQYDGCHRGNLETPPEEDEDQIIAILTSYGLCSWKMAVSA